MSHTDTNRNIIPCAKYTPVTVIQVLCSYHICIGTSIIEGDYCTLEVTWVQREKSFVEEMQVHLISKSPSIPRNPPPEKNNSQ